MPKIVPTKKPDYSKPVDFIWLGQYVRYKRTTLGIGLVKASIKCGLSKTAYSNVELGRITRVDTFFKVLNDFGVRLSVKKEDQFKLY
jgi:hypothetical protein